MAPYEPKGRELDNPAPARLDVADSRQRSASATAPAGRPVAEQGIIKVAVQDTPGPFDPPGRRRQMLPRLSPSNWGRQFKLIGYHLFQETCGGRGARDGARFGRPCPNVARQRPGGMPNQRSNALVNAA